jgi:hypothetical protein
MSDMENFEIEMPAIARAGISVFVIVVGLWAGNQGIMFQISIPISGMGKRFFSSPKGLGLPASYWMGNGGSYIVG